MADAQQGQGQGHGQGEGLPNRNWVLLAVGVGTFMSALDGSVVNALLPVMKEALKTDVASIEWVVTTYLLVVSGLLLGFGRVGDLRGHRGVYLLGLGIFVGGSALCGAAPNVEFLVGARVVQAVGAAMVFSNSPAILTLAFPGRERGRALGLQATMTYLGLSVGPALGGWLTEAFGWRSIFYINVPVGLGAIALSWKFVPHDAPKQGAPRFDYAGAAAFLLGMVALLFALNRAESWGWSSPALIALLVCSGALLISFVLLERRVKEPMLDLTLFRSRTLSAATASALLNYICIYGVLFVMPFYLIQARGMSPAHAGVILISQPIVMMVTAPLSGTFSDRIGTRAPAMVGMAILAVGLFLLSRLPLDAPMLHVIVALCTVGLGTGLFVAPNNSALMGAAPKGRQGIAAGVLATARNAGMVLGVGLAGAIFDNAMSHAGGGSEGVVHGMHLAFLANVIVGALGVVTAAVREH